MRSSTSAQIACPATTPTVNSETPMIPTASPCVATVSAPAAPPASIHQGMLLVRTPATSVAKPRRPIGSTSDSTMRITSPEPNEIAAATKPSSRRSPSWPLIRAWTAVSTPTSAAPESAIQAGRCGRVTDQSCRLAAAAPSNGVRASTYPGTVAISSPRPAWLSWLPALILVVIIVGVVLTTVAVQNSWWTEDDPVASSDQKATDGASMLSDAGLDYVNVQGILRVRIGDGALPATGLGLGAEEEKAATFRRPVRAIVAAGDETYLVDDVETMNAVADRDVLTSLSLGVGQARPWPDAVDIVRSMADDFGWDAADIDAWDEELAEFTRDSAEGAFTAEVTSADEAQITGTLVFDRGSGFTTLTITFAPLE